MNNKVDRQAGYVIHTRAYRDTSMIVDFFTLEHGRISGVVRGARRPNSKTRSLMQPFIPLSLSWQGRSDLKTITLVEAADQPIMLSGQTLMCGLYVNELLQRLLTQSDSFPKLYVYYQYALNELLKADDIEGALRTFERRLLAELGYALAYAEVVPELVYRVTRQGELKTALTQATSYGAKSQCYLGSHLIAIGQDQYDEPEVRQAAKFLMRQQLSSLLGNKPLRSRELFVKLAPPRGVSEDSIDDRS